MGTRGQDQSCTCPWKLNMCTSSQRVWPRSTFYSEAFSSGSMPEKSQPLTRPIMSWPRGRAANSRASLWSPFPPWKIWHPAIGFPPLEWSLSLVSLSKKQCKRNQELRTTEHLGHVIIWTSCQSPFIIDFLLTTHHLSSLTPPTMSWEDYCTYGEELLFWIACSQQLSLVVSLEQVAVGLQSGLAFHCPFNPWSISTGLGAKCAQALALCILGYGFIVDSCLAIHSLSIILYVSFLVHCGDCPIALY